MPTASQLSKKYKHHYVYRLTNLFPTDTERFYVGVHSCNCQPEKDNYWGSSNYLGDVSDFAKEILSTWKTREEANAEEQRVHENLDVAANPEYYNRRNANENFHNGGWSEKTKKKVSEFNKKHNAKPEVQKRMKETTTTLWQDPNYRKKVTNGIREKWQDPEWKEKTIKAMEDGKNTPEAKKKKSEALKKSWACPKAKAKRSVQMKKIASTPEERKRRSEAAKKQWADPEYRKMMSKKFKEAKRRKKQS